MRSTFSPLLAALLLACDSGSTGAPGPGAPKEASPPAATPPPASEPPAAVSGRYEGSGMVLDKRGVGPQLCLGAVATSLPPQCSGVPLVGWDWARVEGEQTAGDTTWGEYRVVGTYDGKRLTPTEPPGPPKASSEEDYVFGTPCSEPASGWARPDPKKMGDEDLSRINEAAQAMPGFAGLWVHNLVPPRGEQQDFNNIVVNVAFTKDLEKREPELRKLWGGALCVTRLARSEAELTAIRSEAEAMVRALGLEMLTGGMDVVRQRIYFDVTVVTAEQAAKFKEKFGETVFVRGRLRPLP